MEDGIETWRLGMLLHMRHLGAGVRRGWLSPPQTEMKLREKKLLLAILDKGREQGGQSQSSLLSCV